MWGAASSDAASAGGGAGGWANAAGYADAAPASGGAGGSSPTWLQGETLQQEACRLLELFREIQGYVHDPIVKMEEYARGTDGVVPMFARKPEYGFPKRSHCSS